MWKGSDHQPSMCTGHDQPGSQPHKSSHVREMGDVRADNSGGTDDETDDHPRCHPSLQSMNRISGARSSQSSAERLSPETPNPSPIAAYGRDRSARNIAMPK